MCEEILLWKARKASLSPTASRSNLELNSLRGIFVNKKDPGLQPCRYTGRQKHIVGYRAHGISNHCSRWEMLRNRPFQASRYDALVMATRFKQRILSILASRAGQGYKVPVKLRREDHFSLYWRAV
ncbi:hypothetical protein N7447_001185 [Penicillium robsamsonii]|uniref:uncharacterized protein n=1 Tax=Penicillium robsamsonii TaxID=1792511 RepID=UPI0025477C68|nr:uncharacterized protein N7447_001185 [Penicillium robsamsonii]KAJ5835159.1 hypothetical protein N7447_001185 [Penicillium robsamsonii]